MTWYRHIGRRLKLRDLYILITVAQEKGMGRAAAKLDMTQPAVSNAIADLERIVGYRLLDRNRRGVQATAFGNSLIKRAMLVFDELKEGIKEIEFLADPTAGEIRIGVAPALAVGFVPAIIERLARTYPRLAFHVIELEPASVLQQLRDGVVDIGVARLLQQNEDDLDVHISFDNPYEVVAAAKSPWVRRRAIHLHELAQETWALPLEGTPSYSIVLALFREAGIEMPRATVTTSSLLIRKSMAATGRFLAIIPRAALKFPPHDQSIKSLKVALPKIIQQQAAILTVRDRTTTPVTRLFIGCAREVARILD